MGCWLGTAAGTMAISSPPVAATWPRGPDLQPPPFPTSNHKTNVSFCQLPEPPITNRKIAAPAGEEPFQPLLQLLAHGGQIPAVTPAPDPPGAAWPSCAAARLRRPRSPFSAAPVIFILGFLTYQLIIFHPAPLWLAAGRRPPCLEAGRGGNVGPLPKGGRSAPNAQVEGKENAGN